MADKTVNELVQATQVTATDLFVLEQNGEAKKLTGQTLENWLLAMAEGKGGIQKIEKVSSSGLVDTYRITFSDTSSFTYTVTNGAKGDKGDKTYLWIKYSDSKPTSNADIYDTPDNWMGIYIGSASAAPAGYTQYAWFKIKGEQGNPGTAALLTSSAVAYQMSDSGTIIPSGAWQESVPPVTQGKYLWTRTTITFNTGSPVTSYSVARMGVDGAGSVVSVNNVSPDGDGNITLSAASLGALALSGGTMTGPVNMNGQKLKGLNSPTESGEAATKGYADRYANASNLSSGTVPTARIPSIPSDKLPTIPFSKLPVGLLKRTKVWENASPGSAFGATTVDLASQAGNLNVVKWDIVYISAAGASAATTTVSSEYDAAGHRANFTYYGSSPTVWFRQCSQNGTTFGFESAKANGSEYNSALIPWRIYAWYLNLEV